MTKLKFIEHIEYDGSRYTLEDKYTIYEWSDCIFITKENGWSLYLFNNGNGEWRLQQSVNLSFVSRVFTYRGLADTQARMQDALRVLDIVALELGLTYIEEV